MLSNGKKHQEHIDSCTGHPEIIEITLKSLLNTVQSFSKSGNMVE